GVGRSTQVPSTLRYSSAAHEPPPVAAGAGAGGAGTETGGARLAATAAGESGGVACGAAAGDVVTATRSGTTGCVGAVGPQPVNRNRNAASPTARRRRTAAGSG